MTFSFTTVLVALVLFPTVHRKKFYAILSRISATDAVLLNTGDMANAMYKKMKIFLIIELLVVLPIYLILFICDRMVWTGEFGNFHHLVEYCVHVIGTVMDVQFFDFAVLLYNRFSLLNEQIRKLYGVATDEIEWTLLPIPNPKASVNNVIPHSAPLHHTEHKDFIPRTIQADFKDSPSKSKLFPDSDRHCGKIVKFQKVHSCLYETAIHVNDCYGIPILLELTFIFIALIQSLYNALIVTLDFENLHTYGDDIVAVIVFISWAIVRFLKMVCITTACQMASDEANRTGVLVQKLILSGVSGNASLKDFSHQLLHHRLTFKAGGFFVLDSTLLHSVAGAVTTYLVILLQFQLVATNRGADSNLQHC